MQNSFNNTVIPAVIDYISYLLNRVAAKDERHRTITIHKYDVVEPESVLVGELLKNKGSEMYQVNLTIHIVDENNILDVQEPSIEIPRMINNVFILEGKTRIATNMFNNDYRCRIYDSNDHRIVFDYARSVEWSFPKGVEPHYSPKYFKVLCRDLDGNPFAFDAFPENFETFKSLLGLSPELINKLKVKLDRDDIPDHITYDLVGELYALGDDRLRDSVIDRRIVTIERDFIDHLRMPDNLRRCIVGISNKWFSTGKIFLTDIQNILRSYFRTAKSKYIEIPSNVNPLVYDALKYKVVLPNYLMYNETFTDIIDPANTPENNNVNILNEINVCISLENGVMMIDCYDYPSGKKIRIPYDEYLTKRVLMSDYYDYDKKVVKKSEIYRYKLRLKTHEVNSIEDANPELIEPTPDERLSLTTRRIPMINMSDSVRIAMGCSMIKQSIETSGSEPRLVDSGNDDMDYEISTNITRYNGFTKGKVVKVTDKDIFIQDEVTKSVLPITISPPVLGANKTLITYEASVKEGDEVVPGEIVVRPSSMKGGHYNLGINAHAVYMNYLGYTYEDGVVVSQSYADKATHYSVVDISHEIKSGSLIRGMKSIGTKVVSKDVLVSMLEPLEVSDAVKRSLDAKKTAVSAINIKYNEKSLITPNNTDEGYIVDIRIDYAPGNSAQNLSEYSQKVLEEFKSASPAPDYDFLPSKYKSMNLEPAMEFRENVVAIITYRIIRVNRMKIGDKSANSYGSKGIISLILPDECMPRLDTDGQGNGPIFDIIMNPAAVIGRKNTSQLYECALTKCIQTIYEFVSHQVNCDDGSGKEIEIAKNYTQNYYGDRFINMTNEEFADVVKNKGISAFSMNVGSFSKISYEQVLQWMEELDISETDYIYVPDVVIDDNGPESRTAYTPERAAELGIKGKYHEIGFIDNPVVTGRSYMYKLYHAADYTGKCTSSVINRADPILGKGLRRDEGQKIGEMESWALMSHGAINFLTHNNPTIQKDENLFLNELLITGFVITDQMGIPFGSEYQRNMRKLKQKFEN